MNLGPQLYVGDRPYIEEIFQTQDHINKPNGGGLWTSTFDEKTGSSWVQYCLHINALMPEGGVFQSYLFIPKPDARVYTVDSKEDCASLFEKYGNKILPQLELLQLDFYKLAYDFDAIHLTDKGRWETHELLPCGFYSWDCESTLWLNAAYSEPINLGCRRYEMEA